MGCRSSVVIGRDDELGMVRAALTGVADGRGHVLFLTGEAGIGKSRLASVAADLAYTAELSLMRGRGSAVSRMVPFRCLTEALLSLQRLGAPVDPAELGPYRPVLAKLVPDWGTPSGDSDGGSLIILAEAVLRLTGLAGRSKGCVMVLDDLQDADPDTLAVIEYMIDNIEYQPTLVLGTIRSDDCPAMDLAKAAGRRGTASVVELDRLGRADVAKLAESCLGTTTTESLPSSVIDLLWAGSAGNPFLIEELLDEMVGTGRLVLTGGMWQASEMAGNAPPAALVRGLAGRFERLGPQARELLSVAAVLGVRFPLAIVQAVTGHGYRNLLSHLQSDLAAQMVQPDDQTPDWYVFKHALVADALLSPLGQTEHADLARRAADAVEAVHPGLPGDWCQLCATLRYDAGEPVKAGRLYAEAGQRALAQGAARSAVTLLAKALELLVHDPAGRVDALEAQLFALVEAGLADRALAMGKTLDEVSAGLDRIRRAQLHTRLAWVANLAGRTADGLAQVRTARALLGPTAAPEHTAPIDVVAAHLELDQPGAGQLDKAEQMALRAATVAEGVPLPVVACQAWQLLGALTRRHDPKQATEYLERSRALAVQHDLPIWEIHAMVRLGLDDALHDGGIERLEQAREMASRIGAVTARYQSEVNIGLQLVLRGEFNAAQELIDDVLAAATRLQMLEIAQYMLVLRAVLAGHRGARPELTATLAELGGDQPQHTPRLHGLAVAFCSLLEENREQATADLATALAAEQANPTTFHLTGRYGLDLLLRALAGTLDQDEYDRITANPAAGLRWDRQFALFAAAVLAGRAGKSDEAAVAVEQALQRGELYPMARHLGLRLVGEAALLDGWGAPDTWLRAAEQYFHDADRTAVSAACRSLLRQTGFRVAQRRSGVQDIPVQLRQVGVTAREYEVLRLLGARLANREIADRLHLSLRTVEKHVSSLITKTGQTNRLALGRLITTDHST